MYLTKIIADVHTVIGCYLFDNYRWKQSLYKAFDTEKNKRPFLFTVREKKGETMVLLLSKISPKHLSFGKWETKRIADNFYNGDRYLFELTANPTVKKATFEDDGARKKQGKRSGLNHALYE